MLYDKNKKKPNKKNTTYYIIAMTLKQHWYKPHNKDASVCSRLWSRFTAETLTTNACITDFF